MPLDKVLVTVRITTHELASRVEGRKLSKPKRHSRPSCDHQHWGSLEAQQRNL